LLSGVLVGTGNSLMDQSQRPGTYQSLQEGPKSILKLSPAKSPYLSRKTSADSLEVSEHLSSKNGQRYQRTQGQTSPFTGESRIDANNILYYQKAYGDED